MKTINKQKFLAELGRLLTFMYEDDRQTAIAMYNRMFDEADDEQALLQFLVSPTRQAVILARKYDARERKLQVHTQTRDESHMQPADEIPEFVTVIERLQQEAMTLGVVIPPVSEDQISLFDDVTEPEETPQADAENPAVSAASADTAPEAVIPAVTEESTAPAESENPAATMANAVQEGHQGADTEAEEEAPAEADGVQAEEKGSVEHFADAVDAFLADFSIANGELIHNDPDTKTGSEPDVEPGAETSPGQSTEAVPAADAALKQAEPDITLVPAAPGETEKTAVEDKPVPAVAEEERAELPEEYTEYVRKTVVALLILYIILAVPLTLIGIAILLLPTLLFLLLAFLAGWLGIEGIIATFGGFAVLADILVVVGAALVVLALALLFLWIFVWLVGGAIVGLIRGVCWLGGKWCYKEVAVR